MIVKREFVRFKTLFEADPEAKAVFYQAARNSYREERLESILKSLLTFSLSEREMGWCLRGISDVLECFERLDREKPFDTGLSPHQTCKVKVVGQSENSVVLKLMTADGETIGLTRVCDEA